MAEFWPWTLVGPYTCDLDMLDTIFALFDMYYYSVRQRSGGGGAVIALGNSRFSGVVGWI